MCSKKNKKTINLAKPMDVFLSMLMIYITLQFSLCSAFSPPVSKITHFESLTEGKTLISSEGSFEFGFFSLGNSTNRYLGIWYSRIPIQTIVWVANRCKPINDTSGILTLNQTTNLVLRSHNGTNTVWSTSPLKRAENPVLELQESGNLVLRDDENGLVFWQSFDYPTDTLLPDMKLGWDFRTGVKRSLSSWRSWDDPCHGNLTYGFEFNSNSSPEIYLRKGNSKFYRSGPWNGVRFSGVVELIENPVYKFQFFQNDYEMYYMYSLKIFEQIFPRVYLNESSGTRVRDVWAVQSQSWNHFSSAPNEDCDIYNFCGPNGVCSMTRNNTLASCGCLTRFSPRSPRDRSRGCVRVTPLVCPKKHRDGFVKVAGLKVPDTTYSWVDKSVNLNHCRAKCLDNCSCTAYTSSDIRGQGSGCVLWFGDLMDIRQYSEDGQSLFVRISAMELAKNDWKRRAMIIALIVGSVFALLIIGICICKRTYLKDHSNQEENEDIELPLFDFATISTATQNFAAENKLGEGGFGPVYKGTLKDGREIAVKRLSKNSGQGPKEFRNEVILIAKLQHRNLVRLLGCCIQGDENLLVYEYLPNKSLEFFIFDETRKMLLDWPKRFEIICGIARGILYLHQDSRLRIIHRDLKLSNVLLDNEMTPKISDFGMAKSFGGNQTEGNTNRVVGTYGYMAPEYASDGLFSVKSDVFSFGVLVLEIISGKKNRGFFNPDRTLNLTGQAWRLWKDEKCLELVDECLLSSCPLSQVFRCVHISLLCVQHRPEDRPSMSSVVVMLGSQSPLVEPNEPGFFMDRASRNFIDISSSLNKESSSTNELTISQLEPR